MLPWKFNLTLQLERQVIYKRHTGYMYWQTSYIKLHVNPPNHGLEAYFKHFNEVIGSEWGADIRRLLDPMDKMNVIEVTHLFHAFGAIVFQFLRVHGVKGCV